MLASCGGGSRSPDAYAPGLGEIMTLTQMRHAKLYFAGEAENWPLASYETDELEEGFHDAIAFHPTHKDAPVSVAATLPAMVDQPVAALRTAIAAHDKEQFERAFDALTDGCNACHRALQFGFNVVRRPTVNAYSNQDFVAPAS